VEQVVEPVFAGLKPCATRFGSHLLAFGHAREAIEMNRRLVTVVVLVLAVGALAMAGQPPATPAAQDGFVPVNALPQTEQLPAAPLLIAAYSFVWVALMVYVWFLWRRMTRVERELAELNRRVQSR
jgi:CcmD family protein